MNIGLRIREVRLKHHLTLEKLGNAIDISIHNLSRIERGTTTISADSLVKIANYFSLPVNYFITGKVDQFHSESMIKSNFIEHKYWLRPETQVRFILPNNLTKEEATTLARLIEALPCN